MGEGAGRSCDVFQNLVSPPVSTLFLPLFPPLRAVCHFFLFYLFIIFVVVVASSSSE